MAEEKRRIVKQTIGELGHADLHRLPREVAPLILPLGHYLTGVQRRLAALHARFVAGTLPAAPRAARPVSDRVAVERAEVDPGRRAYRRGRCC